MEYARLGSTGLKVSRLCVGAMTYGDSGWQPWILSEEAGRPFIKRALDLGINFFDTADMYSSGKSEEVLGRALRDFASRYDVVDRVVEVATAKGIAPAQVALAWLLRQPGVTAPIVGASKMEQLDQAVAALDVKLTDEEARRLEAPYVPHAILGM